MLCKIEIAVARGYCRFVAAKSGLWRSTRNNDESLPVIFIPVAYDTDNFDCKVWATTIGTRTKHKNMLFRLFGKF